jgi:hypothetical protein
MTKPIKILMSIPSFFGIAYMFTFLSIDFFKWITNNVVGFEYQIPIVNGLILIQIGYLIYRLWNYKKVDKKTKTEWTWLLLIFNFISSLLFIWKKDAELNKMNKISM